VLDGWDDEQLLGALRESMRARRVVPEAFVDTGKSSFAWHNIDAELAQLTYDSRREPAVGLRSETASIRALTFTSAHVSLEVEVTESSLLGQVIPPQAGTLETQTGAGSITSTPVDEIGCFAVEPIPASPFRLRCRAADGSDVLTGWITLLVAGTARRLRRRELRRNARSPRPAGPHWSPSAPPKAPRGGQHLVGGHRAGPASKARRLGH
jgi:hypothetical protein